MESTTLGSRGKPTPRRAKDASSTPRTVPNAPTVFLLDRTILSAKPGFIEKMVKGATAFGVYSLPDQEGLVKHLCTAKTEAALLRKLRKLDRWPVLVYAVKSARELQVFYEQPEPDEHARAERRAYQAIAEVKRYKPGFAREVDPWGDRKPGRRRSQKTDRRMIELLRKIMGGATPKALVPGGSEDSATRGLHVQVRRVCLRVYETWEGLQCPSPSAWRGSTISQAFKEACGFSFPRDLGVARYAVKRGKKYAERQRQRS